MLPLRLHFADFQQNEEKDHQSAFSNAGYTNY